MKYIKKIYIKIKYRKFIKKNKNRMDKFIY